MKQALLRHAYLLLAALVVISATSGCWFSSENQNSMDQQDQVTEGMSNDLISTVPDDIPFSIIFEEPETTLPEDFAIQQCEDRLEAPETPPTVDDKPRVAIIIDDMGYHRKIGDRLLDLDLNLSFSFLPQAPFTSQQEKKAHQLNRDVMVHLPMEASDPKWDPGLGALYLSASPEELILTLKKNLAAVPYAIGTNNHMGSKFTENRQAMNTILVELKKHGLFFIDSFTTAKSTAMKEAVKLGIKTNRRHIFLDNVQDPKQICIQLDKLSALAQKQNQAIGIGHPYQATLDALRNCSDQLQAVQLVSVHKLVE